MTLSLVDHMKDISKDPGAALLSLSNCLAVRTTYLQKKSGKFSSEVKAYWLDFQMAEATMSKTTPTKTLRSIILLNGKMEGIQ